MSNIDEANRMLDLFTSVGATRFNVTFLDALERKTGYFPQRTPPSMRFNLPAWMSQAAMKLPCDLGNGNRVLAGQSIIIRPVCRIPETAVTFVQLDDLKAEQLDRIRPASFLIHSTSAGNFQAWIAVSGFNGETAELCRRVRKALGAGDHSATGSTRLAGTFNWKRKYLPEPPVISIVEGAAGRVMTLENLRGMGLLAEPEQAPVIVRSAPDRVSPNRDRAWPSYDKSLAGAPVNREGTGPSRSHADYWWCYLAAQRGFTVEEISAELPNVSPKARERIRDNDPGYVTTTAENAAAAWMRKGGGHRSRA